MHQPQLPRRSPVPCPRANRTLLSAAAGSMVVAAASALPGWCLGAVGTEAVVPPARAAGRAGLIARSPAPMPLAGTAWRLVELQSMDDAQGTTRIEDPSRFTLRFENDGTAHLRLDCNRAKGNWTAEPSADPGNGSLRFGPLASTRALCPPPQLDEKVLAQLRYVRGFLLKEGRLYLSLMADGGILVWEPLGVEGSTDRSRRERDPALEAAIRRAAPGYRVDVLAAGGSARRARYAHARVDLNGDGRDETMVYLMGPFFCGTGGCNLQVYAADGPSRSGPSTKASGAEEDGGYRLISDLSASRPPVIVSERRTNGWRDLWRMQSGGGMAAEYVRHSFDGRRYVERERVPADRRPEGVEVLGEGLTFSDGLELEPAP